MTSIVLVTEHALTQADAQALLEFDGSGGATPLVLYVAIPEQATSASMNAVLDDWEMNAAAGRGSGAANHPERQLNPAEVADREATSALEASLQVLRAAGMEATGEVTPKHPLESIGDMVAHRNPDEVVVMIRHHKLSSLTSSDLAARIQRKFGVETIRLMAH